MAMLLGAAATSAQAQCDPTDLFGPSLQFATGSNPSSVAIGDLDGDGTLDLAVANAGSSTVSVLLGNGDGTFQTRQDFATGSGPSSVAIGDLNGDGVPDLAVVNQSSSTVSVLLGNGDGTFQPRQDFATGGLPRSVAIGDLNGDGTPDLAVANLSFNSNSVSVLLGNGDGTFQARQDFAIGDFTFGAWSVAIGDLNGDGVPDLAVAVESVFATGNISVLLGNGDGTFQPRQELAAGSAYEFVAIVDLNGDGIADLVALNRASGNNSLRVLLSNGDGTFQPQQIFPVGTGTRSVAIGDLDADGIPDLAVAGSGFVRVLRGNGNGTFQPFLDFAIPGSAPSTVAIGDLDADGVLDLAVVGSNAVIVLLNQCVPVSIINQPVSRLVGPAPEQVVFSVTVQSVTPETYQWTRDGQPIENSATITGAQSPTLTLLADASSIAEYRCVITNDADSVTSISAVLGFRCNTFPAAPDQLRVW